MLRRSLAGAVALACLASQSVFAAAVPTSGVAVPAAPYVYTPISPGQHNLAPTVATGLTVPSGAIYATVCASTATVKYTTDGTTVPSGSVGQPLASGVCVALSGATVIANFQAYSATGTLDIEFFK